MTNLHHQHHRRRRRRLLFISTGLGLYLVILSLLIWNRYLLLTGPQDTQPLQTVTTTKPKTPTPPKNDGDLGNLPDQYSIEVPFTVQAPLGIWDALHEEACEEASLLMVVHAKTGKSFNSPAAAEVEIQGLVSWETAHGYKVDLTLAEMRTIAAEKYDLSSHIVDRPTVADIRKAIAGNHLVIVPAAGRVLGNPNFTPPGPIYHMLVIRGYNSTEFITNDPGTRHGENYRYPFEQLMNAIHDWNSVNILDGERRVLIFE